MIKGLVQRKSSARDNHVINNVPIKEITIVMYKKKDINYRSEDILFYDIPAKLIDEQMYEKINKLGRIEKMSIKKQFKYLSVRVKIRLLHKYREAYIRSVLDVMLDGNLV